MGPRLFSRGEVRPDGQAGAQGIRFNGAAAFQPRRGSYLISFKVALQSFNGAVAFQPRRDDWPLCGFLYHAMLQWGRGFSAAESHTALTVHNRDTALQWGRGFSAAERRRPFPGLRPGRASMGPRLFSRGETHPTLFPLEIFRFNGAAAFQPRRAQHDTTCAVHSNISLQWGRGFSAAERFRLRRFLRPAQSFNGAAAFQPRRGCTRLPNSPLMKCFNGAAAFQPRRDWFWPDSVNSYSALQWGRGFSAAESLYLTRRCLCDFSASMGPRLFSRGELRAHKEQYGGADASMGPRLFSRGEAYAQWEHLVPGGMLQWGRGFSAAESHPCGGALYKKCEASMGPRLFSRGESAIHWPRCTAWTSFNGAAAFQPRRVSWSACAVVACPASMGPRLFSRGEALSSRSVMSNWTLLQWGRGFSAAERAGGHSRCWSSASLQWGRGFSAAERHPRQGAGGQRGPLQWGRGFSAAERHTHTHTIRESALQWGRGFSAAESMGSFTAFAALDAASMGPRLFSRGEPDVVYTTSVVSSASMGPRLFSRGEREARRRAREAHACFNGAAAFQPRRGGRAASAGTVPVGASMGPRLFSRGEPPQGMVRHPTVHASMGPRLFSRGETYTKRRNYGN